MLIPITVLADSAYTYHKALVRTANYGKIIHLSLKDAIFLALRYNPSIKNAEIERVAQKFNVRVAENAYELNFALNGSASVSNTRSNNQPPEVSQDYSLTPSVSLLTQTGTQFELSMQNASVGDYYNPGITFSVTQPLLRGANPAVVLAPLYNAYDNEVINKIELKGSIIDTIVTVINDYRDVINEAQSLRIDQRSLKRAQSNYLNTEKFIEAGQRPRMDLAQAKLTVTQNKITILADQKALAEAKQTLLLDLGIDPSMRLSVNQSVKVVKYKPPNLKNAEAIALQNSPTYQEDLVTLRIDRRALLVAQDNARWSLDASYQSTWGNGSGGPPNNNLRSIWNGTNNSQEGMLTLDVPINDVNSQQAIIDARVELRQQEITTDLEEDTVKTDVINGLRELKLGYLQLQESIQAEKLQVINLKNTYRQFKAGTIDSLSVSQQQDTLTQAEQTVLSNQITYLNSVTSFRQLLQLTLHYWKIKLNY